MAVRIYTGTRVSEGAHELSAALKAAGIDSKVLRTDGSLWRPRAGDTVINWGSSRIKDFAPARVFSSFASVATSVNKVRTFEAIELATIPTMDNSNPLFYIPKWATSVDEFRRKCPEVSTSAGFIMRTTATGHSGIGTYFVQNLDDEDQLDADIVLVQKYITKAHEYRVHVVAGEVIDVQEKRRRTDTEVSSDKIRSHSNGWVFCRGGVEVSDRVKEAAVFVVNSLGLDFGAVDIMTLSNGSPFVLEVNSAPGLSETTAQKYAESFVTLF